MTLVRGKKEYSYVCIGSPFYSIEFHNYRLMGIPECGLYGMKGRGYVAGSWYTKSILLQKELAHSY